MNEPSRAARIAAIPMMLLAGGIIAIQSQVNGHLGRAMGSGSRAGIGAAVISFGTGLVLLTVVVVVLPSARAGTRRLLGDVRARRLRPHEMLGGGFGAFLVATQGLTVATIGVALFSVALTAGQAVSGLAVDHFGIGPSGHQALSIPRAVASSFAVIAVVLAAGERLVDTFSLQTAAFALLPLLAGFGTGIQLALNGRLNAIGGPWATTFNNFLVGTVVLLVCWALSLLLEGHLTALPRSWWLYTGGVMGVAVIWLAARLVKVHGVLVLGLCMIAGQVLCAELIEVFGSSTHVGIVGVVAGALTVVGVLVALLLRPASPRPEAAGAKV